MEFDEVMFAPIQSRDIGRSFLIPPMMMPMTPIYPYYGLQPLQGQPAKDVYSGAKVKKADNNSIKKIVLGTAGAVAGLILLKKGIGFFKGGKVASAGTSIVTALKNLGQKVATLAKTGYTKVAAFAKNLFRKPTP